MSKIALSGNASGTGTFTFAAPNSNSDRTLTLPDASGEVVINPSLAGMVATFAMNTPPAGWLKADGAAVSRTTYAALFTAIGTTFGVGDGSTTFNLPDLRGEFIRGWDDGRGVDSGRAFGSAQGFAMQNITGSVYTRGADLTSATGAFSVTSGASVTIGGSSLSTSNILNFAASNSATTAAETRPRNIALLACIKF
jgi:phage-related tail fiber protein